ncbi:hypothetical protein SADUNF_Sadunf08G0124000 [Salix dunnii]|uniref:Uncharacterized protein n=1 Tax=Salix dunnii TaxID=1413687 RepID=A0A835JU93_9ROSI|nr:hypothetical protein SADUNF_Sadunf08G0124000 [Salix dunnii]
MLTWYTSTQNPVTSPFFQFSLDHSLLEEILIIIEATFKSFSRALRQATEYDPQRLWTVLRNSKAQLSHYAQLKRGSIAIIMLHYYFKNDGLNSKVM